MTDSILSLSEMSIRAIKIRLKKIDKEMTLKRCLQKAPLVADIQWNPSNPNTNGTYCKYPDYRGVYISGGAL